MNRNLLINDIAKYLTVQKWQRPRTRHKWNITETIFNRLKSLQNDWMLFLLRTFGVEIASSCLVGPNVTASLGFSQGRRGQIKIDAKTQICQGVILEGWGGYITIRENAF